MKQQPYQINIKLVFAGKHGVGKTSLLTRQTTNQFTMEWLATIGVDFKIKYYKVGNVQAKTFFWDTAGQQRFRSIQRPYYKGAHAVLLCFDLSDKDSFDNLQRQIQEIRGLDLDAVKIYLIGCKSDLEPKVFTDQIILFSQRQKCEYFQTSSKQNEGVSQCFQFVASQAVQRELQIRAFSNVQNKLDLKQKPIGPVKRCC